jgi:simple sugar transport system permease protein
MPLFVFLIVLLIFAFLLRYTTYGEKLYMIGSNPKAARFSAINTTKMLTVTFVISGVCAAIGALLMVSTYNSAKADYGSSYLMRCILILCLAGVLPDGGIGKIFNALIAIVTIQIIATCVNMFPEINSYYGSLIWGVLLLIILMATTRLLGESKLRKTEKKSLQKRLTN